MFEICDGLLGLMLEEISVSARSQAFYRQPGIGHLQITGELCFYEREYSIVLHEFVSFAL